MGKLLTIILCIFLCISVQGQTDTILLAEKLRDKAREFYRMEQYDSIPAYYDQAAKLFAAKGVHDQTVLCLNNAGDSWVFIGEYDRGIKTLEQSLELALEKLGNNHEETGQAYNFLGIAFYETGDLRKGREYFQQSLEIRKKLYGVQNEQVAGSYINIGIIYDEEGDYAHAIDFYSKGIEILMNLGKEYHRYTGNAHQNIGGCYRETGNFDQAVYHFQKALDIRLKLYGPDHYSTGSTRISLANCYGDREEFDKAMEEYLLAEKILVGNLGTSHRRVGHLYRNMGFSFEQAKRSKEALYYKKKALTVLRNTLGEDHPSLSIAYNSLAASYVESNPDSAMYLYRKGLKVLQDSETTMDQQTAEIWTNISILYQKAGLYDSALAALQIALMNIHPEFGNPGPYNHLLTPTIHRTNLLRILGENAKVYFRKFSHRSGDTDDLVRSLAASKLAMDLIDSVRVSTGSLASDSRKIYSTRSSPILSQGIETALTLFEKTGETRYQEEAYRLIEKNKFLSLVEASKESEARKYAGIPDSLIRREFTTRNQIGHFEYQMYLERQKGAEASDRKLHIYEVRIEELKQEAKHILRLLEDQFPAYYQMKYNIGMATPDEVRTILRNDQAILEYHINDSLVTIAIIHNSGISFQRIPLTTGFKDQIYRLRNTIVQKPGIGGTGNPDSLLISDAQELYDLLLRKPLTILKSSVNSLIIIPDGILGHLPFEMLLGNKPVSPDFRTWPYLIRDYQVSYAFSGTVLASAQSSGASVADKLFGGFAANNTLSEAGLDGQERKSNSSESAYLSLPGALDEIRRISRLLEGEIYQADSATEAVFKNVAHQYRILHLAMHAVTDDEHPQYSRMLFTPSNDTLEDGMLHASELYNLELQAQLAVLSACNTGFGKVQVGEGVLGLSHAFRYAGCPSLVMSLWQIPDMATSDIMVYFYEGLMAGKYKDQALSEAKIRYLDEVKVPELGHPYYWAGFIAKGDMAPIQNRTNKILWSFLIILTLIVMGVFGWQNRR